MVLETLSIMQVTYGLSCKPKTGSLSGNVLKGYMGQLTGSLGCLTARISTQSTTIYLAWLSQPQPCTDHYTLPLAP